MGREDGDKENNVMESSLDICYDRETEMFEIESFKYRKS